MIQLQVDSILKPRDDFYIFTKYLLILTYVDNFTNKTNYINRLLVLSPNGNPMKITAMDMSEQKF